MDDFETTSEDTRADVAPENKSSEDRLAAVEAAIERILAHLDPDGASRVLHPIDSEDDAS